MDRRTLPPSSGYPGIRLKIASAMLMYPSHTSAAHPGDAGVPDAGRQPAIQAAARNNNPIIMLVAGPTMLTQNSDFASLDSPSALATPPSANNVMDLTGIPREFATAACANSCTTILAKKSTEVIAARVHVNAGLHCVSTI